MGVAKILTREDIERAMKNTRSNRAAARYLHVSYPHYRKYAYLYKDENGQPLYEKHFNRGGQGIPKNTFTGTREPPLVDILEGKISATHFSAQRLKYRLMALGYLEAKCSCCGFDTRRPLDGKMPLILDHIDGDKNNWSLENLRFLCYNCSFLMNNPAISDALVEKQEDFVEHNLMDETAWELDDYQKEFLKSLGLPTENEYSPGEEFISKI